MTSTVTTTWRQTAGFVLAVFVLAGLPVAGHAQSRVVAVGDVHGDISALVSILKKTGIVDEVGGWAGGDATLVQVGDMIDRGLKDAEVLDFYMALESQAAAAGGEVVVLLGNHEIMNLMGDLRYVSNYAPFADTESDTRRETAYEAYMDWSVERARVMGKPAPEFTDQDMEEWMKAHYRGYVEREAEFGPDGRYGVWLRTKAAVARLGDFIFVHGGISPSLSDQSIDQLNRQVAEDVARYDAIKKLLIEDGVILRTFTLQEALSAAKDEKAMLKSRSNLTDRERQRLTAVTDLLGHMKWMSWRPDGPAWFRGYDKWAATKGPEQVASLRDAYGENVKFVVGHSVMKNKKIHARFGNSVFLIDTGMSAMYYRGKPSSLEISNGGVAAVYRLSRETFVEPAQAQGPPAKQASTVPAPSPRIWWDAKGQPLPFRTDAEVMEFMRTADVISKKDIGEGVTNPKKLLLEKDGVQMNAIFRYVSKRYTAGDIGLQEARDDCIFECAAYTLSAVLGINNIPPVVSRRVDGKSGTVQIWVEHAMTEKGRREKGLQPFDPVRWAQDWQMVEMFDDLIYNDDRNTGNIIIDQTFTVWMIDHTRAFRAFSELRQSPEKYLKQVERRVWDRLRTVENDTIKEALEPFLQSYEIDGLLKRRRNLVSFIQGLIDQNGEDAVLFAW